MYGAFKFIVVGTCTSDPEYSVLQNGTKRCSINVAVNTPQKKDNGEYEERTTFVRLAFFGQAAERKTLEWCTKGESIYCEGSVTSYKQEVSTEKTYTMYNFRPDVIRPLGRPVQRQQTDQPRSTGTQSGGGPAGGPDDDFPDAFS